MPCELKAASWVNDPLTISSYPFNKAHLVPKKLHCGLSPYSSPLFDPSKGYYPQSLPAAKRYIFRLVKIVNKQNIISNPTKGI